MRLTKLAVLALSGSFIALVSWLPGCSAEPLPTRAIGGSGGLTPAGTSGTGTTAPPTTTAGNTGAGGAVTTAGTGGSSGDVTAGSGGSVAGAGGGSAGAASGGGGTGGSGGAGYGGFNYGGTQALPERTCETASGPDALLDDFEDSNTLARAVDGRNGGWSTYTDGSASSVFTGTSPAAGVGRDGGAGWCVGATDHTSWGANIVLKPLAPTCGYDASIYTGICFYAKGTVDAGGPIEFGIGTGDTVPTADGGVCTPIANCWYGYMGSLEGLDENEYQEYCFSWEELAQWEGTPAAAQHELDPASIVQMEWKFTARGAEAPTNGELCLDDVRFMTE